MVGKRAGWLVGQSQSRESVPDRRYGLGCGRVDTGLWWKLFERIVGDGFERWMGSGIPWVVVEVVVVGWTAKRWWGGEWRKRIPPSLPNQSNEWICFEMPFPKA